MRGAKAAAVAAVAGGVALACGFDDALREYLNAHFWLPLARQGDSLARGGAADKDRLSAPFAGMGTSEPGRAIGRLRLRYQRRVGGGPGTIQEDFASARADRSLSAREREEVELLDAKFDIRAGVLDAARRKLEVFLKAARTPEYLSEARGWLAHIHFRNKQQAAAGKLYLDELARRDSNLSRETLVNSLRLVYGYDGGPRLIEELDQYFDTPEHAAFAIHLATNPRWDRYGWRSDRLGSTEPPITLPPVNRILALLEKHRTRLFSAPKGADLLALLSMRTALRAGDPPGALRMAAAVPATASIRRDPDFLWMHASALFLTHRFAAAEAPLLALARSKAATDGQRAAAVYGLCGVYQKTGNRVEQLRYALRAYHEANRRNLYYASSGIIENHSLYWMVSGWDLNLLLEYEASIADLQAFLSRYGASAPSADHVRYALAVRLARGNHYDESAALYESLKVPWRASRMRELAELQRDAAASLEAKYKLAALIADHQEGIYFNDRLWNGLQRFALDAAKDTCLTRKERETMMAAERKLRDDQEEYWRAYQLLDRVVRASGKTPLGRQAAKLAVRCLRSINTGRFGRDDEIAAADIRLSLWLGRS